MNFNQIISDIKQLVGLELQAVNPSTASITLVSIDLDKNRYIVQPSDTKKQITRNIEELKEIFYELDKNAYCNVDQVLLGGGSSRHHPETIFANLPYIQFFKLDKRKHLLLRNEAIHELGKINELSQKDLRNIRSSIIAHKELNINQVSMHLDSTLKQIQAEIKELNIKTPGFLVDSNLLNEINELEEINKLLSNASVNKKLSNTPTSNIVAEDIFNVVRDNNYDLADIVDSSLITGVDEGSKDDEEDNFINRIVDKIRVPNIRRQTPSLSLLYERLHYNEIEIQPEYQRKDRIWPTDRKSKLIESILMGLPLPIFYFGERSNDNWVIIDGLQRLTTIQDFMRNDFPLKLEKDSTVFELNGKYFNDFDRKNTRALKEFEITAYVIDIEDKDANSGDRFIIELFHRINTYGVKLSEQEIRSAINFGPCVYYLKNLAISKDFIKATCNTINPKRQKDVELVLSALAFIIFGYQKFNYPTYNAFLSDAMKWINFQDFVKVKNEDREEYLPNSSLLNELTRKFIFGLNLSLEVFGRNTFKKNFNSLKKEPISKPLFEVLVSIFAHATDTQRESILNNRDKLIQTLYSSINNDTKEFAKWESSTFEEAERGLHYALSTSTSKRATVIFRFESILNIIKETTNSDISIVPLQSVGEK